MKDFKAEKMNLQSMSNVRGGEWDVTLKDSSVTFTAKQQNAVEKELDITIEVSIDIEAEY